MPVIDQEKCTGCRTCQRFCTVDAIHFEDKKCRVDPELCTECYVCLRMAVCPENAIYAQDLENFYKQLQHVLSDPVETHAVTGVTGRGTEEVKTNDVTGRVNEGEVGFAVEFGRPGVGAYFRDVDKVTQAVVQSSTSVELQPKNPVTALMSDLKTGKIQEDVLNEKVMSCILEFKMKEEDMPEMLKTIEKESEK